LETYVHKSAIHVHRCADELEETLLSDSARSKELISCTQLTSQLEEIRTSLQRIETTATLTPMQTAAAVEDLKRLHTANLQEIWSRVLDVEVLHFIMGA
jgi:hypothetical protein